MAKTRALARPIIVSLPRRSPGRFRRAARRVGHVARRGASHGRRALPTIAVGVGGIIVGYIQSKGYLDKLPQIGGSKVLTLGLAGYAATRFSKNPNIRAAGLAALAAAAVDFGRVQGGGTSGFEDVSGDAGGGPGGGHGY